MRRVAPELLYVVITPHRLTENMDNNVEVIQQHPVIGRFAFVVYRSNLLLAKTTLDPLYQGADMAGAGSGGDDKKVAHRRHLTEVVDQNILSLGFVKDVMDAPRQTLSSQCCNFCG